MIESFSWDLLVGIAAALPLAWLALVIVLRLVRRLAADKTLPRGVRVWLGLLLAYLGFPIDRRHRRAPRGRPPCRLDAVRALARHRPRIRRHRQPHRTQPSGAMTEPVLTALAASAAAFALVLMSAVARFGVGCRCSRRPPSVRTPRCGSDADTDPVAHQRLSGLWLNRRELRWPLIGWLALGGCPCAVAGGLLLAHTLLTPLKWVLGVFLIGVVTWRAVQRTPRPPTEPGFAAVEAASGIGAALLGSV
ncbi:TSUP family transporter [Saccharopolyspora sp. 5N708]|uniref:TSUP family transporter n=1 Tax=Saccharopolyspora sp. 5N708 TaxID=3457424 RepID=UPI003FD1921F